MDPPVISAESPPLRSTILGSFLGRGRPRNSSQSHPHAPPREASPSPQSGPPSPTGPGTNVAAQNNSRRGRPGAAAATAAQAITGAPISPDPASSGGGYGFGMLRRRRSAGTVAVGATNNANLPPVPATGSTSSRAGVAGAANRSAVRPATATPNHAPGSASSGGPFRLRLVPHLDSRRSLRFDPVTRDMRVGDPVLRIGRFTDRSGGNNGGVNNNNPNSYKLAFKSKVVSRAHAELWVEMNAEMNQPKFFIRDTKSSSGTFLNHVRLAAANTDSRPFQIKDGDILQLGVDYQGGSEDIYKSVKIRVEVGREWMRGRNEFNTTAIKNLKSLAQAVNSPQKDASGLTKKTGASTTKPGSVGLPDCCICLFPLSIAQSLFVSPCSHSFHFKCIRPLLETHYPNFSCPLCRTFADLDEDVEVEQDEPWEEAEAEADMGTPEVEVAGLGEAGAGASAVRVVGVEVDALIAPREADEVPGDEDSAVEEDGLDDPELEHDPDLRAAIAASRITAAAQVRAVETASRMTRAVETANAHLTNPFSDPSIGAGMRPPREPRDGAETEVESDIGIGLDAGSTLRGPGLSRAAGAGGSRPGHHARNLSAQMVDPLATEGMNEEFEGDQEHHGSSGSGDDAGADVDVDMVDVPASHDHADGHRHMGEGDAMNQDVEYVEAVVDAGSGDEIADDVRGGTGSTGAKRKR